MGRGKLNTNLFIFKLLILNTSIFLISLFLSPESLVPMYGFNMFSENFNIIQPFTSMFLHGNFSHLFFNMLMLFIFGYNIEYSIGTRNIILLYLISGISGWFLSSFIQVNPSIGSSGAVSGIMASILILYPEKKISLFFLPITFKLKWLVLLYFVVEICKGFMFYNDGISHFAHIGGFIGGYLYCLYLKIKNKIKFGVEF
jgi:membrane associated rhomboid family serine protease